MPDAHARERLHQLLTQVHAIIQPVSDRGWSWRVVGGAVRDAVLGRPIHDIDIEVVVPSIDLIADAYRTSAPQGAVGTVQQVVRVRSGACWVDLSATSTADVRVAAAARDFTINALALMPDGTLVDPFDGLADCAQGVVRHIGDAFVADPVRVLRLMRFVGQLGFAPAPETLRAAQAVSAAYPRIAIERIWHEWRLTALSPYLADALEVLRQTGWLQHYPMLAALEGCVQDPIHHPEGDVWIHTKYVCAGTVLRRADLDDEQVLILSLAAICHDLGKPTTTYEQNGRWYCPDHAAAGVPFTQAFLAAIGSPSRYAAPVCALVREHMAANDGPPTPRSVRRLAKRLEPATMVLWAKLVGADSSGRPPLPVQEPGAPFLAVAAQLAVTTTPVAALVNGSDVIACGIAPGPQIKTILAACYDAQLDGVYETRAEGLAWLQGYLQTAHAETTESRP